MRDNALLFIVAILMIAGVVYYFHHHEVSIKVKDDKGNKSHVAVKHN